ncbi:MAG: HAD family hydrolase [Deltaproteobacteria bacterium]|nr:HAD family hydrolase [Deltaproteobacteria bacterium]
MNDLVLRPAIFLDRDGTLNREKNYLIDPADFTFIPGVPQALKRLQDAGFLLVVVTNQSGVARGYYPLAAVENLHRYLQTQLASLGVQISAFYVCPHYVGGQAPYNLNCSCRKPRPGLLLQAAAELKLDLGRSFMIGDKLSDVQAGQAAGCRSLLVRSGHPLPPDAPFEVLADLAAATEKILDWEAFGAK